MRIPSRNAGTWSGSSSSCQCTLLTITTGALSHAPRHSIGMIVNIPEASVWPAVTPSSCSNRSTTRSAPASAHDSVVHTCSTYLPTGVRWNIT